MSRFHLPERRLVAARGGIAAIEFALLAPFIILVMLAGADLSRFMRTTMRVDETANEVAVMVTQYADLYDADFNDLFSSATAIAGTTAVTGVLGATIISGIGNTAGKQTIVWQKISASATFSSRFGVTNAIPALPNGYLLPSGATLIAVEVYTSASPWLLSARLMGGSGGSSAIRSYALFQPRLGSLAAINPGNRP